MKEIFAGVFRFSFLGGFVNVYLIETPNGNVLIDASISGANMDAVVKATEASGHQIDHVFITHAHADHMGGLGHLQTLLSSSIPTYIHFKEAPIARGEKKSYVADPATLGIFDKLMAVVVQPTQFKPTRIDHEVKGGDKIAEVLEVVELPGHSYGHSGLWWAEKRILIGGDVMMHLPWGLTRPLAPATPDMTAAEASIRQVIDLNPAVLCLGHGAPLVDEVQTHLQKIAARL